MRQEDMAATNDWRGGSAADGRRWDILLPAAIGWAEEFMFRARFLNFSIVSRCAASFAERPTVSQNGMASSLTRLQYHEAIR